MTPEEITKLPRWAQREVGYLNDEIDRLSGLLTSFKHEQKLSDFLVKYPGQKFNDTPVPLSIGAEIIFKASLKKDAADVCLERDAEGIIRLTLYGRNQLAVVPRSSNTLEIVEVRK